MMTAVSSLSSAQGSGTDVLLIDDSVADLRLLIDMMSLRDLRVSVALSGDRGYQQAILLKPSLVLMDVRMPGMDGISTCRLLKSNPALSATPVIFLTAANDLAERLEGFAAGAVDYIGKPFDVQEVLARVGVHLQRTLSPVVSIGQAQNAGHNESTMDMRLVVAAQQLLRETIANPPGLDRLARLVGTNRRRLNDAFQALCGQPVFGWLREERMRQANIQISGSQTPFSVISDSLGYSTPANFSKAFRQRFGCSPSAMRSRLQGVIEADSEPDPSIDFDSLHFQ